MNRFKRFLPNFLKMTGATFLFVVISTWLGAFGVTSLIGLLALSLALLCISFALYAGLVVGICWALKLTKPGVLLISACGIVGGSLTIAAIGWLMPGIVLLSGLLAAVPYAATNIGLIWLVGWSTGSLRKDITFLPQR